MQEAVIIFRFSFHLFVLLKYFQDTVINAKCLRPLSLHSLIVLSFEGPKSGPPYHATQAEALPAHSVPPKEHSRRRNTIALLTSV
jgi:hypothetical protein